jgi:hypothetical protein
MFNGKFCDLYNKEDYSVVIILIDKGFSDLKQKDLLSQKYDLLGKKEQIKT